MKVLLIVHMLATLARAQAIAPNAQIPRTARVVEHLRTIGQLVKPADLVLTRAHPRVGVTIPLPRRARASGGTIDVAVAFRGTMIGESNVRVLVNDIRRAAISRAQSDSNGRASIHIALSRGDLVRDAISLSLEAATFVDGTDACDTPAARRLEVRIDPQSSIRLTIDPASLSRPGAALDLLPDTVTLARPALQLTAAGFDTLLRAATELAREGHEFRIGRGAGEDPGKIVLFAPLVLTPPRDNPTLSELAVRDLAHPMNHGAQWNIPIDLRALPPGRAPDRIILTMVSAPRESGRDVPIRVYLNERFVRTVGLRSNGDARTVRIRLPEDAVRIYNEVHLIADIDASAAGRCGATTDNPAEVRGDSYVVLADAPSRPRRFATFVAALPSHFPIYVPSTLVDSSVTLIPVLVSTGEALWGPLRQPRVDVYDPRTGVMPPAPSVVVLPARDNRTTVQLTRMNGQAVLAITPALHAATLASAPEAYGDADSVSFDAHGIAQGLPRSAATPEDIAADSTTGALLGILALVLLLVGLRARSKPQRITPG